MFLHSPCWGVLEERMFRVSLCLTVSAAHWGPFMLLPDWRHKVLLVKGSAHKSVSPLEFHSCACGISQAWLCRLHTTVMQTGIHFPCFNATAEDDSKCKLPSGEAGIIWDSICFAFLLLQRRVFMSYYFLHVVADIKASQILASRWVRLLSPTTDL